MLKSCQMMSNFRKNNLPLKELPFFWQKFIFFGCDYSSAEKLSKYTTYAHVSFHFLWNSKTLAFGIFYSYLVPLDIEIRVGSPRWRGAQQPMVEVHHYGRDRNLDFGTKMLLYFTKEVPGDWLLPFSTPVRSWGNSGKQTLRYDHVSSFRGCGSGPLGSY